MSRPIAIVTGGRDYELTPLDEAWLLAELRERDVAGVIHGDANTWAGSGKTRRRVGADRMAAVICQRDGIPAKAYPYPGEFGKRGGPIRNERMAKIAAKRSGSVVLAFPGGRGTNDMINTGRLLGLEIALAPSWEAERWQHGD